jgi:hypothetical protein
MYGRRLARRRGDRITRTVLLRLLTAACGTKRTYRNVCPFVRFRREADMHDERLTGTVKICYRSKTGFAGNEGDVGTLSLKNGISEHAVERERECTLAPISAASSQSQRVSDVLHKWARRTDALVQRPLLPNFSDQLSRSRVKTRLLLFFG